MRGQKGISPIVGFVLATLIAVIVITGMALLGFNIYDLILEDQIKRDLTQVGVQISSKINDLHSLAQNSQSSPGTNEAVLLAEAELNLPREIADRNYRISLLSASQVTIFLENITLNGENATFEDFPSIGKVVLETTENPETQVLYDIAGINAEIQGTSGDPGNATLRYYRYNPNGTIVDLIVIGDSSLIGQVTVVS